MGCDGGTIPKRDELVKTKKKPEQKDKAAELTFRWQHCALSQAPLQPPVVACEMGRIYNKDSVIEALLNKSSEEATVAPVMISHIKSLKDVKVLNLTENPAWAEASQKGDGYNDNNKAQWTCPISGQEMNGIFRFVFLWTCGCVFSERALKEITVHECLKCQKPFTLSDVIILNPTDEEEIQSLKSKMEARKLKAKEAKKGKKSTTASASATATSSSSTENGNVTGEVSTSSTKPKDNKTKTHGTVSEATKRSKLDKLETRDPKMAKISGSYSVAKDPKVSATYKSLFTSSEDASAQQKAHWVTYNPFYN